MFSFFSRSVPEFEERGDVAKLARLLRDRHDSVRHDAEQALIRLGSRAVIDLCDEIHGRPTHPGDHPCDYLASRSVSAMMILGQILATNPSEQGLAVLKEALEPGFWVAYDSGDSKGPHYYEIRTAAARALGVVSSEEAIGAVYLKVVRLASERYSSPESREERPLYDALLDVCIQELINAKELTLRVIYRCAGDYDYQEVTPDLSSSDRIDEALGRAIDQIDGGGIDVISCFERLRRDSSCYVRALFLYGNYLTGRLERSVLSDLELDAIRAFFSDCSARYFLDILQKICDRFDSHRVGRSHLVRILLEVMRDDCLVDEGGYIDETTLEGCQACIGKVMSADSCESILEYIGHEYMAKHVVEILSELIERDGSSIEIDCLTAIAELREVRCSYNVRCWTGGSYEPHWATRIHHEQLDITGLVRMAVDQIKHSF